MLKLYVDLMSQPSRAVYIAARKFGIPFTKCTVDLRKGEHKTDEYAEINPFQLVPAIDDDGFKLTESVAIIRYLCRKHDVPDHWYPKDLKAQARVDEYLEWQHINTRANCALFFQYKFLRPKMFGTEVNQKKVDQYQGLMETTLEQFETIWLKNGKKAYVAGDQVSVADLFALTELEQPSIAGYDIFEGRPILTDWFNRVKEAYQPHYDEGHKIVYIMREKFGGKVPSPKL